MNEALVDQIQLNYKSIRNHLTKESIRNILTGKIIKKCRRQTALQNKLKIPLSNVYGRNENNQRILKTCTLRKKIKDFYINNSIVDPGKKAYKTKNKIKYQKRYITDTLLDLHKKFVAESGLTVCYKTFCLSRPFYVIPPTVTARDTCACTLHENFKMLLNALHTAKVVKEN